MTGSAGFSQTVSLTATGVPTGGSASFSSTTVTPTSSGATTTLTIQTGSSTPVATSTLTITGTAGTVSHSTTVQLTVTKTRAPAIEITSPIGNGGEVKSSSLHVSWNAIDGSPAVDHYEVMSDDGAWTNIGTQTSYEFNGLIDGNHTFNIKAVGVDGVSQTYSISVLVAAGFPTESIIIVAIIIIVLVAVIVGYKKVLKRPKKPPALARYPRTSELI